MLLIDNNIVDFLTNKQFFCKTHYGLTVTTIRILSNLETRARIDFIMRSAKNHKILSQLFIYVYTKHINIIDFKSSIEHTGNGKKLLMYFSDCIKYLGSDIHLITGSLSPIDYDHWDKLIYMYSTFIRNTSVIIENKYTSETFLSIINEYKGKSVNFQIHL